MLCPLIPRKHIKSALSNDNNQYASTTWLYDNELATAALASDETQLACFQLLSLRLKSS